MLIALHRDWPITSVRCGLTIWEICIVALAGFCSGVIKTGVGIGSGVFLLPTLSLAFPAKLALGLGAPMMLASDILGLRYYWKQWASTGTIVRLLGAAIPGLIAGTLLLPVIPAKAFRIGIGIFGMFYAVSMLWPSFPPALFLKKIFGALNERHAGKRVYIYGASGGIATVLAHAGGLVWSLYLLTELKDKRIFVGTIVLMFFLTNTYKTFAYLYVGTLNIESLISILPSIPLILAGSYVGNFLNIKMNSSLFRNIVLCFIFIVSFNMCL